MAQHKAPTQVTVVEHEEKSAFAEWVDRHWKLAAVVAVAISGTILAMQWSQKKERAGNEELWDQLNQAQDAEALDEVSLALAGTRVEPWALVNLIHSHVNEREYGEAKEALGRLRSTRDRTLVTDTFPLGESGAQQTLADHLEALIDAEQQWNAEHPTLFENAPLPDDCPKVRLQTSAGDVVLGLYPDAAPKHVEQFLKHCQTDFYVGTKFHRVMKGFMIQGGDPNTKEDDVTTWGQGGPGFKIEREENDLYHFRAVLSAAKKDREVESSGSQFFITTAPAHHLDGQHVIFGAVLEGMDVVDEIENGELDDPTSNRPVDPVEIVKATVL